jgi:hypothetical protein
MNRIAHMFTVAAVAFGIAASAPVRSHAAAAERGDAPMLVWMAASNRQPLVGHNWGRLTMKDGVLTFHGADDEAWQMAIADIRRVAVSAESDKLLVIETVRDERFFVAIAGIKMVVSSPRKALDAIQSARRAPAGRR